MQKSKNQFYPKTISLQQLPEEVRLIIAMTADAYMLAPEKLWQRTRKEEIVDARQIAISIIFENYGGYENNKKYSLKKIGSFFNRDHTTIIHAIRKSKDLRETDVNFKSKYDSINESIKIIARRPRMSVIIAMWEQLTLDNALIAEKWLIDFLGLQKSNETLKTI